MLDNLDFLNLQGNSSSGTNQSSSGDCKGTDLTFIEFFKCTQFYISRSLIINTFYIVFSLSTALLNLVVIYLIQQHKKSKTVFDKIFIGHAFVDFLVGILVIPLFCIYSMFDYWPFSKIFCHIYVSLDFTICHVGILHMVYLSYARLRSLISPKNYQAEFFIANSGVTMFGLWILSALLWLPSVNIITNLNFKSRECFFTFVPLFIITQDLVAYITPIVIILSITAYILRVIHVNNKRREAMGRIKNLNKLLLSSKMIDRNPTTNSDVFNQEPDVPSAINRNSKVANSSLHVEIVDDRHASVDERLISLPNRQESKQRTKFICPSFKVSAYAKLYVILATFCILWLPFCILWPVKAVAPDVIPEFVFQASYWMGYAQSFINPLLLLILNQNYRLRKYS